MGERSIKVRLTGWKAIAVLAVVVAIAGYRYVGARTTLQSAGADELRFWLAAEYQREGLPALEEAVASGNAQAASEQAQEIIARSRIDFVSMTARGTPDDLAVRVEISVDGGAPPDGKTTRCFRMRYSSVTGWRMQRETSALSYYLKLF